MAVTAGDLRPASGTWRTPLVIIVCGCAIALLSFGPRSSLGFFVQPMGREFAWGRDVFGLAIALQNLLWGLGQPIAGAIADRFGLLRVMIVGALLYAAGLLLMRYSTSSLSLDISAGVLIGFGLSGSSFNLVLAAFSKLLPPEKRGIALGAGTAAGSFGQFLFAPFGAPTNAAIMKYMNQKKVPHLFIASGATKFGDYKNFPYTMGFQIGRASCRERV